MRIRGKILTFSEQNATKTQYFLLLSTGQYCLFSQSYTDRKKSSTKTEIPFTI